MNKLIQINGNQQLLQEDRGQRGLKNTMDQFTELIRWPKLLQSALGDN
jgi:hypothetical protein